MATPADLTVSEIYRDLVKEVIIRAFSINTITGAQVGLHPLLIREYCFLQLRMMCELIALGCLLCHGDIEATKARKLQKAYVPADILGRLGALHPDFYPVPVTPMQTPEGWHMADFDQDYLKKEDLIALWSRSGDHLHKGNIRRFISIDHAPPLRLDDIQSPAQNILNLLSNHRISRLGGKFHFLIKTNEEASADEKRITVTVAIAESG